MVFVDMMGRERDEREKEKGRQGEKERERGKKREMKREGVILC